MGRCECSCVLGDDDLKLGVSHVVADPFGLKLGGDRPSLGAGGVDNSVGVTQGLGVVAGDVDAVGVDAGGLGSLGAVFDQRD